MMPMKPTLKKGITFQWLPEYDAAFRKAREHLSSNKCLAYYNPLLPTRLVVDASRLNGLGFVLKQRQTTEEWKPVQAGSRFLTSAETRYAMIELEMLAIAWACAKTRIFVDGLPRDRFEIWTDHAPLVPILENQTLPEITNRRLQRLKMKVEHLTFKTLWIKGKENVEADALSRYPCATAEPEDEIDEVFYTTTINMLTMAMITDDSQVLFTVDDTHAKAVKEHIESDVEYAARRHKCRIAATQERSERSVNAVSLSLKAVDTALIDEHLNELRRFCLEDAEYQAASQSAVSSWPPKLKDDVSEDYKVYFRERDNLHHDSDGFLCHNNKFVVPKSLRKTYLMRLLSMHQAAAKMVKRARQSLWWPYMHRDVTSFAKTCQTCEKSKPSNQSEPIQSHTPATYSFQYLHLDLAQWMGRYYLIMIDQFSSFPHLVPLGKTATTDQVISVVTKFISLFSVPEIIYSDGGPQFVENGKFPTFCTEWGIRHVSSSPYMSNSNGVAEEAVKEMKKIIKANTSTSGVLDESSASSGLMMFRNTARSPTDLSPAQILFGHAIRDSLPAHRDDFVPTQRFEVERRLRQVRELRDAASNKVSTSKELSLLFPGQLVRVQDPTSKKWDKVGTIVNFGVNDREYKVNVDGSLYRRNRKFLKPQDVETFPPFRQPAQAPPIPAARTDTTSDPGSEDPQLQSSKRSPHPPSPTSRGPTTRSMSRMPMLPVRSNSFMKWPPHKPLPSQAAAFKASYLTPTSRKSSKSMLHSPIPTRSPPVPSNRSTPSAQTTSGSSQVKKGLPPPSSMHTQRCLTSPPRELGTGYPPLPTSGGTNRPMPSHSASAENSSTRPKWKIKKPVRFQAGV